MIRSAIHANTFTVCERCGNRASLGRDVVISDVESYFIECQQRRRCTAPFPALPSGWQWERVGGFLYVAASQDSLQAARLAALGRADEEAATERRQAAQAQKDFYTRGKGARTRMRTAKAIVGLFAAFKAWGEAVERSRLVTRQELLADAWTNAEIENLLGEPDKVEAWRQYGQCSGDRYLYDRARVADAEPRRGRRIALATSGVRCFLVIGNSGRVWVERDRYIKLVEIQGSVADALVAVVESTATTPRPSWWKRKLVEILESDRSFSNGKNDRR